MKIKAMLSPTRALLLFVCLLFTSPLYGAGSSASGLVTNIVMSPLGGTTNAGVAFVYFATNAAISTTTPAPPACATQTLLAASPRYVIDLGTPGGQGTYSLVLAARLNGTGIFLSGTGNCNVWGDTESVQYLGN